MKNTINKFALLLGVIAVSTLSASAQGPGGPGKGGRGQGGPGARAPREVSEADLKKFDENGNGKLEPKEMEALRADRKAKWDAMSEDERKEATAKRRKEMEERRAAWEKLTPEERKAEMEKRMKARFDKDGDGKLSEEEQGEMDKAMEEMQKRMRERGARPGGAGDGEGRRGPGRGERKPKGEGGENKEG